MRGAPQVLLLVPRQRGSEGGVGVVVTAEKGRVEAALATQHHTTSFYLARVKFSLLWHPLSQPSVLPRRQEEEEEWGMGRQAEFFTIAPQFKP